MDGSHGHPKIVLLSTFAVFELLHPSWTRGVLGEASNWVGGQLFRVTASGLEPRPMRRPECHPQRAL